MTEILPVVRPKQKACRFYDRISSIYDWLAASEKSLIKRGVKLLSVEPDAYFIEIGCGTGTALRAVSSIFSGTGAAVGLDLSHQMLLKSQEKLKQNTDTVHLVQGDGVHLPVRDQQFNRAFCAFTLELFSEADMRAVLKEIRRILQPSGRLVIAALAQEPRTPAIRLYELAHQVFSTAVDCRPIPLNDLLVKQGFIIETTEKSLNWGLPVQITLCRLD
jgi:ubiquinone/menaquinone biosynthesis C-methylase UbiE